MGICGCCRISKCHPQGVNIQTVFEMRRPTAPILILLISAISWSRAEELKAKHVPAACATICNPVVLLSNACEVHLDEGLLRARQPGPSSRRRHDPRLRGRDDSPEDRAERFCMCRNTSFDVEGVTGLCASCLQQNGDEDAGKGSHSRGNANLRGWLLTCGSAVEDINEIMSECAFSSTSYAPAAATAATGLTIVAMIPTLAAKPTALTSSSTGGGQGANGGGLGSSTNSWGAKGIQVGESRSFLYILVASALAMALS